MNLVGKRVEIKSLGKIGIVWCVIDTHHPIVRVYCNDGSVENCYENDILIIKDKDADDSSDGQR